MSTESNNVEMLPPSRTIELLLDNKQTLKRFENLSVKYLHSQQQLTRANYKWQGEVHVKDMKEDDTLVVIDCWAYRAVHQTKGEIKRIRNGGYLDNFNGIYRYRKIVGVIRNNMLYIVVNTADKKFIDISPTNPVRATGVANAYKQTNRFSSAESNKKSA